MLHWGYEVNDKLRKLSINIDLVAPLTENLRSGGSDRKVRTAELLRKFILNIGVGNYA